ncbi:MAG: hypothetical protein LBW85_07000 [Deltaproteobacteria bacterium]|jgi:predicted transposase/invertase (TIGR01784 family)|nr:hypothetical protein [Deltaproteobacteria bacterium]
MAKKSEPLQSAEGKFSSSEYEFTSEQILAREKLERDFEETRRVGREEGREESRREVVSNALKLNLAMDQIAAITGLPLEEASRLADSLKG